jgi:pimeloyl-ACP methyl ester carboxylesterase
VTSLGRRVLAGTVAAVALLITSAHRDAGVAPTLKSFAVRAGAQSLRAVRAGQGTPVVLLHGYGESLLAWHEVFQMLARTADVIALDLPGFGLSSKPRSGYTADSMAATVVRALDALGVQRPVLVGHSLGGAVAAAVALTHPDRATALVLVDPAVAPAGWPLRAVAAESARTTRRLVADWETLRARLNGAHDPAWLVEPDTALSYNPAADPNYRIALESVLREFDFAYLDRARARRLRLPVLVLWGAYDPVMPLSAGRDFAAALPDGRLEVIPRSWHRPHEERPAEVAIRVGAFLTLVASRNRPIAPSLARPACISLPAVRSICGPTYREAKSDTSHFPSRSRQLATSVRLPRYQVPHAHRYRPRHGGSVAAGSA